MSVKINPILPKHQPPTNYKPTIKPKIADKTKQTNQAIRNLAVRFGGDDEPKPAKKTAGNLYLESLRKNPIGDDVSRKYDVTLGLDVRKSTNKTTVADYAKAFDRALFNKADYAMLTDDEVKTAADMIKDKNWKTANGSLKNLRAIDNKPGQMYANTNQYSIELAKRAGAAVLQFNKNESETFDKNQAHGNRYMPEALGGFVQPIVNAPVNVFNGLSEPFRAGEKMLFGTQNIPVIPRMEVAERSEYWNKDGRMFANKGAEIGATIVFGGGAGAKALATKGGRALLGVEASYNFAAGGYGKDVNRTDANGNPRQMDYLERGGRVFGGVFGARQVVKAEITAPNSLVNKLDDIFKPKPPTTEAITPEGFRVKVPQTENVKGANVFEIRRTPKELAIDESLRGQRADKYAELVKSNEPWKWAEINKKLTYNEKQAIKELAIEKGLVPKIQVDSKTGFADFSKHVVKEIQLPKKLWNKSDFIQFKWLDKKIGGRPKGHTWHHHQDSGKMQLVEFGVHNITNHTGGRSVWATGKR